MQDGKYGGFSNRATQVASEVHHSTYWGWCTWRAWEQGYNPELLGVEMAQNVKRDLSAHGHRLGNTLLVEILTSALEGVVWQEVAAQVIDGVDRPELELLDDGTMDTVFCCSFCHEEVRYTCDGEGSAFPRDDDGAPLEDAVKEAAEEHSASTCTGPNVADLLR